MAIERDWLVTVATHPSNAETMDLSALNTLMRRIDLSCKVLAPAAVGFMLDAVGTSARERIFYGAAMVGVWNALEYPIELVFNTAVFYGFPELRCKEHFHEMGPGRPPLRHSHADWSVPHHHVVHTHISTGRRHMHRITGQLKHSHDDHMADPGVHAHAHGHSHGHSHSRTSTLTDAHAHSQRAPNGKAGRAPVEKNIQERFHVHSESRVGVTYPGVDDVDEASVVITGETIIDAGSRLAAGSLLRKRKEQAGEENGSSGEGGAGGGGERGASEAAEGKENEENGGEAEEVLVTSSPSSSSVFFHGVRVYTSHPVFLASVAYTLLYCTVLDNGALMTAYLEWRGVSAAVIGAQRGIGAVFGLVGTVVFPVLLNTKWMGGSVEATGLASLWLFWLLLLPGMIAFYISGESNASDYAVVVSMIISRAGLWSFDLAETQIMQQRIVEEERGIISSMERSLYQSMTVVRSCGRISVFFVSCVFYVL